jgi:hypothetical protein
MPQLAAASRTRRSPFFRSHPSLPLTLAAHGIVAVGTLLPATPLAATRGFQPLPGAFFAALAGMVVAYLALIETGKQIFYRAAATAPAAAARPRRYGRHHLLRRRAARFSTAARSPATSASGPTRPGQPEALVLAAARWEQQVPGRGGGTCRALSRRCAKQAAIRQRVPGSAFRETGP